MTQPSSQTKIKNLLQQLHSDDADEFGEALDGLMPHRDDAKKTIYAAAIHEQNARVKGALLELLGATRDNAFVPYLKEQTLSRSAEVRFWATAALHRIESRDLRELRQKRSLRSLSDRNPNKD